MSSETKHTQSLELPLRFGYSPETGFGSGYGRSQIIDAKGRAVAAVAIIDATYERGEFDAATLNRVEDYAAEIVRGVNCHPDLLAALKALLVASGAAKDLHGLRGVEADTQLAGAQIAARAAILKAGG